MRAIPSRFSETDKQQIADRYANGESRLSLREEYGTKSEVITAIIEEQGGAPRNERKRKLTPEQEASLRERYEAGESMPAIAEDYGVTHQTVRRYLKRANVELRPNGLGTYKYLDPNTVEKAIEWHKAGRSQTNIAKELGCSQAVVSRAFRSAGYDSNQRYNGGPRQGNWNGGRHIDGSGYRIVWMPPDHPLAAMRPRIGYVKEHRLVMAVHLGRPLTENESVHHINGDKLDNRVENLQLRRKNHGNGVALCCADCGSTNIVERPIG